MPGIDDLSWDSGMQTEVLKTPHDMLHLASGKPIAGHRAEQVRSILSELARRQVETLKLYNPLPVQDRFHRSPAPERLLRGSNRGGKTLPATMELMWHATNTHPYLSNMPSKAGRAFVVGRDGKHLGDVLWRKMTYPGAFKIIRDLETGKYRVYRVWEESDFKRKREAIPAPPMLPRRYIKKISWLKKAEGIPSLVTLTNGWEIRFLSSLGAPPKGSDIDYAWFDEEIVVEDWYPEISARLIDREGILVWSATPEASTEQLWDLYERAEEEKDKPEPKVQEFLVLLANNPHIPKASKELFAKKLRSDVLRKVKIGGEFAIKSFRMYPGFDMEIHGVDPFPIPAEWTKFMALDPGHQVAAALFVAVPPPSEEWRDSPGDFAYVYDELYLRQANARMFAEAVKSKIRDNRFYAFLIDHQAGRQTQLASGLTVEDQYSIEMAKLGVRSEATGSGFIWGSNDVRGGIEAVRGWLDIRPGGEPKLKVLRESVPEFEDEMSRYRKKRLQGFIIDEPADRQNDHLCDALRYMAMYDPQWTRLKPGPRVDVGAVIALKEKRKRRNQRRRPLGGVIYDFNQ